MTMPDSFTIPDSLGQVTPRKGATFGILVAAILVVELPHVALFAGFGDSPYLWIFLSLALMSVVPFILARMAPNTAGFDRQWLPNAWSHWGLFLLMPFLLLLTGAFAARLAIFAGLGAHRPWFSPAIYDFSLTTVAVNGVIAVLLGPIAEELFWRAYALEQLRKITRSAVALLVQALLFALAHVPLTLGFYSPISAFFYGTILGLWRIRFRSLIPLILGHIVLNSVACIPALKHQYQTAVLVAQYLPPDWAAKIRSNPKCRQIALLTSESADKALPTIIGFLGDSDESVRTCATWKIMTCYRNEAEPYLKEALASNDKKIVEGVLFTIEMGPWRWPSLKEDVRNIVWSADDLHLRMSATLTLWDLKDVEALRDIAEKHPEEKIREAARRWLQTMKETAK
jgi:membrane protease YdiL (CAAX protease family)